MDFLTRINSLSLLRPSSLPAHRTTICLIVYAELFPYIEILLHQQDHLDLHCIAVPNYTQALPEVLSVKTCGKTLTVPVVPLEAITERPELEKVYLVPPGVSYISHLEPVGRFLAAKGIRNIYLGHMQPTTYFGYQHNREFYAAHKETLARTCHMFADEQSREVFAARVKAICTGDAGYLPMAPFPEYYHPLVSPQPGDIMIDGGVSDMVGVQKAFAQSVGTEGRVYGFEPIPDMYTSAKEQLAVYPQYSLACLGLSNKPGQVPFELRQDSSRMCATEGANTVLCSLTSIDTFVAEQGLEKVDCIKLDIEGAELSALMGARNTITRMQPKLIICLYHKPEDLLEIPALINHYVPDYELYVAHSNIHFIDTILYARPRQRP